MVAGDFNFSAQPTSRLTIVNNTSVNNLRINGPSSYTEVRQRQQSRARRSISATWASAR